MAPEMQALWTGNNTPQPDAENKPVSVTKYQYISLWWYVMLLALVVAVAETALSSRYLGTQREDI
jgi:hypothetical protein